MGDPRGFLTTDRELPRRRPVDVRIRDWQEVYEDFAEERLQRQAGRCMDCGIPFCHQGCPLGNLIPEWNDLVWRDDWREAIERLHATNNFPEFTGRLCPAPCETACVLGINSDPVSIKQVEVEIVNRAWDEGWINPQVAERLSGKTVAVVGSGPAGLAAAQQLTRAGHTVVVYERADRIGGLLRYGIPEFKMEKRHLELRLMQMQEEGTKFRPGVDVGTDITAADLRKRYDALVLAGGSTVSRNLPVPGRDLPGVYAAMDYLPLSNRVQQGDIDVPPISAEGLDVVIIGGGDTGADCLGTALRQGARSVTQLEILPRPPDQRSDTMPWPTYPMIYRVTSAHEEGGERVFAVSTQRFTADGDGNVATLVLSEVDSSFQPIPDTERAIPCQLVLLAMGFTGPERGPLLTDLEVRYDERGNVARDDDWMTDTSGVFACGDMGRGQSLIVWAIAEGRSCAAAVDRFLMGDTQLPAPILPTDRAIA
ncbi:MAG TPA: glutamate synthase subunit beta [Mycobacteriales bacterium]|nr:glutamate synthase subunit beta [Mycobacteriales bacterium]